ncbi:WhiB family transcriptional regulator [Pseudonocardia sp.]|jgi:WhiB family redox-sensing transcriptional regulator|uniref:WhiB family transcriptional regulator n=1 Tax=Pseudonocardia sp. TaxID=60912 RepID=UPI00261076FE|nr:WhiB family transcriptional regulator [Pseudonocardia sp.]MCW2718936.1 transcription factor WhiB [Pseudonocardia sp.]
MIREPAGRDWRTRALCADADPEIFYPVDVTSTAPAVELAKRVCARCPVQAACLLDAMAGEDPAHRWGVIGGTTPDERHALFLAERLPVAGSGAVAA